MSASRRAGALAILLALLVAWLPPARAQVDTEEEREREEARKRAIEKRMQPWQYDLKLVGRVTGTRSWVEGPTRELLDYLLKAPAR